jgi:murein L,D-transpeptidase YcbB/YkuD
MTGMRLDGAKIEQDKRYWRKPLPVDWLLEQAQNPNGFNTFLKSLEPEGPLYARLKEELLRLSKLPETAQTPLILTQTKLLRPGSIHEEFVPILRAFLDIPATDWNQNLYDDELANAVVQFQRANNLKADGIIGPQTLQLMNKTPRDKIHQIIANMERLRWLDPQKPSKYILVNIPAATLWAIENDNVTNEMPVIVGRKDRPTLSFLAEITGVRFNPTWTVPKTIKEEDFLPLLQEDPAAMIKKGIDIKAESEEGVWRSIDPTSIDWNAVSKDDLPKFRMVQSPGATNPLGSIRVLMPNQYNIYLHDTSSPEYFRNSDRAASSGCVRVKEPRELADFILSANSKWDELSVQAMLDKGKMTDISAEQKIPVYLLYLTIWQNQDGSLTYGPDIYDWDKTLIAELYNEKMMPPRKN